MRTSPRIDAEGGGKLREGVTRLCKGASRQGDRVEPVGNFVGYSDLSANLPGGSEARVGGFEEGEIDPRPMRNKNGAVEQLRKGPGHRGKRGCPAERLGVEAVVFSATA